MTTKYPCYIEFSDSGRFMRIVHQSKFVIAELLVGDTNLSARAAAAYDRLGKLPIEDKYREPENTYKGEVIEVVDPLIILEEIDSLKEMLQEFKKYSEYINEDLF